MADEVFHGQLGLADHGAPGALNRMRQTNPGQPRAAFQLAGVSEATSETFLPFIPGRIASR